MTPAELYDLLLVAGIAARVKKTEVEIQTCHTCGNERWNLTLNPERAVYYCWACKTGGSLGPLLARLVGYAVDVPVVRDVQRSRSRVLLAPNDVLLAVESDPLAVEYLRSRGIDALTVRAYGIRLAPREQHPLRQRIMIPVLEYWSQVLVGYVGRTYTGQRPKYLSTLSSRVIGGWRVPTRSVPIVLVEGMFDAIATHRAGFHAAALGGTGEPRIVREWAARVPAAQVIVLLLDGDAAERASRLQWTISAVHSNVVRATLPPTLDPGGLAPEVLRQFVQQCVDSSTLTKGVSL